MDFPPTTARQVRRHRAFHWGAIGICPGHGGYTCLGVEIDEGDGVTLIKHYSSDPATKARRRKLIDLLIEMIRGQG
jgi:hypothetical protein